MYHETWSNGTAIMGELREHVVLSMFEESIEECIYIYTFDGFTQSILLL